MTHFSHSRVDTFVKCPKKFEYRYVLNTEVEQFHDEDSPLLLGSCMDTGLEHGFQAAYDKYVEAFPYHSQKREWELLKLQYWIERLGPHFKDGQFQIELKNDWFLGYADWYKDGHLVDFKYAAAGNAPKYSESAQLHLYCNIMTQSGYEVKDLTYVVIPKCSIREKKTECPTTFRNRLMETLESMDPILVQVEYDERKLIQFGKHIDDITMANVHNEWPAKPSGLCKYCEYKTFCPDAKL